MAQNAEYSLDKLTDFLLYEEAARNSAAAARLTPKGIRNDGIQIAGHSLLWNVVCEKHVVCGPL
jgi:hypothetical protein